MSDDQHVDAYREGYTDGYKAGVDDGRAQGYSDAKYRAHQAIEAATVDDHARRKMLEAVVQIVGAQR